LSWMLLLALCLWKHSLVVVMHHHQHNTWRGRESLGVEWCWWMKLATPFAVASPRCVLCSVWFWNPGGSMTLLSELLSWLMRPVLACDLLAAGATVTRDVLITTLPVYLCSVAIIVSVRKWSMYVCCKSCLQPLVCRQHIHSWIPLGKQAMPRCWLVGWGMGFFFKVLSFVNIGTSFEFRNFDCSPFWTFWIANNISFTKTIGFNCSWKLALLQNLARIVCYNSQKRHETDVFAKTHLQTLLARRHTSSAVMY
jgi:hypothetical protein